MSHKAVPTKTWPIQLAFLIFTTFWRWHTMVHVPLMLLPEWREFPSAPCLAGKQKTWWQLASRCCWNGARRLTCFLSASVTIRDLQFRTWTDPYFPTTLSILSYDIEKTGRAKDLSAPPRTACSIFLSNLKLRSISSQVTRPVQLILSSLLQQHIYNKHGQNQVTEKSSCRPAQEFQTVFWFV